MIFSITSRTDGAANLPNHICVSLNPVNQPNLRYSRAPGNARPKSVMLAWSRLLAPARMLRKLLLPPLASVALMASFSSHAFTDCHVMLVDVFTGDIAGAGQYGLWLDYTYTLTTGGSVESSRSILLSNPAAANISAAAFAARVSGQTNLTIRYLNSGGASADAVCGPPARGDLIGIWLAG